MVIAVFPRWLRVVRRGILKLIEDPDDTIPIIPPSYPRSHSPWNRESELGVREDKDRPSSSTASPPRKRTRASTPAGKVEDSCSNPSDFPDLTQPPLPGTPPGEVPNDSPGSLNRADEAYFIHKSFDSHIAKDLSDVGTPPGGTPPLNQLSLLQNESFNPDAIQSPSISIGSPHVTLSSPQYMSTKLQVFPDSPQYLTTSPNATGGSPKLALLASPQFCPRRLQIPSKSWQNINSSSQHSKESVSNHASTLLAPSFSCPMLTENSSKALDLREISAGCEAGPVAFDASCHPPTSTATLEELRAKLLASRKEKLLSSKPSATLSVAVAMIESSKHQSLNPEKDLRAQLQVRRNFTTGTKTSLGTATTDEMEDGQIRTPSPEIESNNSVKPLPTVIQQQQQHHRNHQKQSAAVVAPHSATFKKINLPLVHPLPTKPDFKPLKAHRSSSGASSLSQTSFRSVSKKPNAGLNQVQAIMMSGSSLGNDAQLKLVELDERLKDEARVRESLNEEPLRAKCVASEVIKVQSLNNETTKVKSEAIEALKIKSEAIEVKKAKNVTNEAAIKFLKERETILAAELMRKKADFLKARTEGQKRNCRSLTPVIKVGLGERTLSGALMSSKDLSSDLQMKTAVGSVEDFFNQLSDQLPKANSIGPLVKSERNLVEKEGEELSPTKLTTSGLVVDEEIKLKEEGGKGSVCCLSKEDSLNQVSSAPREDSPKTNMTTETTKEYSEDVECLNEHVIDLECDEMEILNEDGSSEEVGLMKRTKSVIMMIDLKEGEEEDDAEQMQKKSTRRRRRR
ncbi:hypothetical protein BY996DRAFT_3028779 [Phakopsora pachyrhizi]|nr:hypothetical protein BY996DRAFT_3028779 [Phakopsora pachyrhizi]